jgi:hypothetical protein
VGFLATVAFARFIITRSATDEKAHDEPDEGRAG